MTLTFALALLVLLLAPTGRAQAQFTDVGASLGINVTHDGASIADMGLGAGGAWFDYDLDGDLDLYMTMRAGANKLFQNNGGTFTDVAAAAGAADASHDGSAVIAADFDNDGDKDLYLANSNEDVLLRNNGDGTFTDVTSGSGIGVSGARRGTSASVGDYDGDGFLDLYVSHHTPVAGYGVPDDKSKDQDYLFYNNGDLTFTDVSDDMFGDDREDASFIGAWTDFDQDGDMDIYLIRDCGFDGSGPMQMWRNDGGTDPVNNWTFTDVAGSIGAQYCQNGMGIAMGDYDRNGTTDLFYTDNGSAGGSAFPERAGTILLANNGGTFTDATDAFGVSTLNFSWGANFFDYNLDGWLDLFMAGGSVNLGTDVNNKLWVNNGDGTASDITTGSGVEDLTRGRAGYYGDYDEDGDPDLFLFNYGAQAHLYRNDNNNGNNWLIVDLQGVTSNRDGIGARIAVSTPDGVTQHFETRNGSSLGGGDDTGAYFGLGTNGSVTSMTITWPSGTVQTLNSVGVNQRMLVVESTTPPGNGLFTDVTASAGISATHVGVVDDMPIGTGAAWFDYDNDGDLDLYMTNRNGANWLYQNNGGTFVDVAAAAGVQDASGDGSGVAAADYNNDGFIDLYLANSFGDAFFENNGDGTFTNIYAGSGLESSEERRGTTASWGDYDGDGFVDLYVANHMPVTGAVFNGDSEQDYLYHNNGDGTFTDVSDDILGTDRIGRSFIGGWADYDNDGDTDLYVIRDCPFGQNSGPMRLYRNDGGTNGVTDWTFTQVAETAGADWCQNGMGLATGDYNRDGWLDFFFTDNGAGTSEYPGSPNRNGAVLLRNDNGTFTETTDAAQVDNSDFSWGANFFDYDLDGFQDLYQVAGAMAPEILLESTLWNNDGDGTFTNVSTNSGGLNDPANTRSSAYADYDGDGDLDMFIVNFGGQAKLFRNDNANGNNWVTIDLQGVTSNRDGIGARVELTTPDGVTQHAELRSGSSLGSTDDVVAHFGIGNNASVSNVTVKWPSGTVQTVGSVGINQRHLIVEDGAAGSTLAVSPLSVDLGSVEVGSSSAPAQLTMTNNGVDPIDVTGVSITGTDAGDFSHTFSGPVTLSGGGTSSFDVTFSPTTALAPAMQLPEGVLYRVNAGGGLVGDWEQDDDGAPSSYLLAGSASVETDGTPATIDSSVPAGTPTDLFQAMRRDADKPDPMMMWDFPVTAGEEIEVRLFFVEMSRCSVGNRIFDVEIEGVLVEDDLDVYNEAGAACNVGIMRSYTVTPGDNNLDIDFPLENGRPSTLAAVEILGAGGGGTSDPRSAQLIIDHSGTNPSLNVALSGTATTSGGGNASPVAAFSFAATGTSVDFTDASTDSDGTVVSWAWDFGDGNTSTSQNPTHDFGGNGTFSVSLTVTDDLGATGSTSQDVTVSGGNNSPTAAFTFSVADLTVDFTDASTDDGSIASWAWDFGDGNTSTDQNPVHTYGAYGVYTVSLTVTDDQGATGSTSQDVNVTDPNATGPFLEENGMVVMETESFFTNTDRSGHSWTAATDQADYSGVSAMYGGPNDDTTFRKQQVGDSPEMTYEVDFTTTGTFYVWVRVFAPSNEDNSLHMGLNGFPSASKMEVTSFGSWEWINVNTKGALSTIGISASGVNTVSLWMREDGMYVDKILMTNDINFVPAGHGPAESPRGGAALSKNGGRTDQLGFGETIQDLPTEFELGTNYPNPFNPTTTIQFALPEAASVTLEVYDTMGRRIATLISNQLAAGRYEAQWNGRSDAGSQVASGIYLYRIKAGAFSETKTMLLMK